MRPRCAEEPAIPVGNARNRPVRLVTIEVRALITATLAQWTWVRHDCGAEPAARCPQVPSRFSTGSSRPLSPKPWLRLTINAEIDSALWPLHRISLPSLAFESAETWRLRALLCSFMP